jgi:hypothetical protein
MQTEQLQDWLVPLGGLATAVLIVVATYVLRYNTDRQRHQTIRLMIEKGMTIPPELLKTGRSSLRGGLVLMGVGIGYCVSFGLWGKSFWGVGFIFLFMGLGLIAYHMLERRNF